jgi:hypothetical protein
MKIAIMHYHLKTGGVTTVLKQQLEALDQHCDALVLTGYPCEKPFPAEIVVIPEIAYSIDIENSFHPEDVAQKIRQTIWSRFNGPCDVLHVHNPTLAKNKQFLKILKYLKKGGITLFLQIHDFAEDGRPLAYFTEDYLANCHYGVINMRDYQTMLKAGLNKKGLHRIANAVSPYHINRQSMIQTSNVLYPIRAIRRKNIGEAILLSMFLGHQQRLIITLPPNSPADFDSYEGWKAFVKDQNLNVEFDRGLTHDFESMVMSAEFLITTSITEGFGFSYLEPWIMGKLLWGRKLPSICQDFEMNGIRLNHLYSKLTVPVEWIGLKQFYEKWSSCVSRISTYFNVAIDRKVIRNAFDAITSDGIIDFGVLDEASQKTVLLSLIANGKHSEKLIQLNPFLVNPGNVTEHCNLIKRNQEAILQHYNLKRYGERLQEIYRTVSNSPVRHRIDKTVLISNFFNLEEFSLLKWSDYVE